MACTVFWCFLNWSLGTMQPRHSSEWQICSFLCSITNPAWRNDRWRWQPRSDFGKQDLTRKTAKTFRLHDFTISFAAKQRWKPYSGLKACGRFATAAFCGKVTDRQDTRGVYPKKILRTPQDKWRGTRVNTTAELWGGMRCSFCRVPGHTEAWYKLDSHLHIAEQPKKRITKCRIVNSEKAKR